jgi:divalent metal cation (Fe/Co/Zn/Cd) transporter
MQISWPVLISLVFLLTGLIISFLVKDIIVANLISALILITGLNLFRLLSNKINKNDK